MIEESDKKINIPFEYYIKKIPFLISFLFIAVLYITFISMFDSKNVFKTNVYPYASDNTIDIKDAKSNGIIFITFMSNKEEMTKIVDYNSMSKVSEINSDLNRSIQNSIAVARNASMAQRKNRLIWANDPSELINTTIYVSDNMRKILFVSKNSKCYFIAINGASEL